MNSRRTPPQALYEPRVGELVHDEKNNLNGEYQCSGYGKQPTVFLRPVGGGCEWEAPASEIKKIVPADELEPVTASRPPRRPRGSKAA